jgi:hypothetical protein
MRSSVHHHGLTQRAFEIGDPLLQLPILLLQAIDLRLLGGAFQHGDGLRCFTIEGLPRHIAFGGLSGHTAITAEKNDVRTSNPLRRGYHAHG